jgi:hypothetical protein
MGRKTTLPWERLRAAVLVGSWVLAAGVVQRAAGPEIGGSVQRLGERIELNLRGRGEGVPAAQPTRSPPPRERSHEDTLQPWEHVPI